MTAKILVLQCCEYHWIANNCTVNIYSTPMSNVLGIFLVFLGLDFKCYIHSGTYF
jgi:hypothetical protein